MLWRLRRRDLLVAGGDVDRRWKMPYRELAESVTRGDPSSRDAELVRAILNARLAQETRGLRWATVVMAGATLLLALAAFLQL
jgi:hypothetical protein